MLRTKRKTNKTVFTSSSIPDANFYDDKPQTYHALLSLDEIDHAIRPEDYQQRTLDREIGGLEAGKKALKETAKFEKHIEDVWDKRSDEIDKIGSIDPLQGDDKESMIWQLKRIKQKLGKNLTKAQQKKSHESGTHYDSRSSQNGFSQMIKARQDFSNQHNNSGNER